MDSFCIQYHLLFFGIVSVICCGTLLIIKHLDIEDNVKLLLCGLLLFSIVMCWIWLVMYIKKEKTKRHIVKHYFEENAASLKALVAFHGRNQYTVIYKTRPYSHTSPDSEIGFVVRAPRSSATASSSFLTPLCSQTASTVRYELLPSIYTGEDYEFMDKENIEKPSKLSNSDLHSDQNTEKDEYKSTLTN